MLSSAELRQTFLDFFRRHGHDIVPSSSLIPGNDPTLLFTNAGMVQFKDVFLGVDRRPYTRAASAQRCVRAGGKHNDLENVGYTARHHTFFEMLGNFSFGDYFKREAIHYAWTLLTDTLRLPPERLWVTVYRDDEEAADIWLKDLRVDPMRFSRIGAQDNFWSMGDTGPCGPCSEIFYDHGPGVAGGPPGSSEADGDRYVEIWNLVFMESDRAPDGRLTPLPKPSVDTGMGLERLAAVMQGVHSNYDIDLFRHLIRAAADLAGMRERDHSSLRVIADHIRSCAFLITDGVMPSNEGRGYVLRRIIRRAVRHGHGLGLRDPFFYRLVPPLVQEMGAAYPELGRAQDQVERVLHQEEERFRETLEEGLKILEQEMVGVSGERIPGAMVFKLYDTYGFPLDLTADYAKSHGLTVDLEGFEREMATQRERGRAASQFGGGYPLAAPVKTPTAFSGYERLTERARIVALFQGQEAVEALGPGTEGMVILDRSPFYAESGGQMGDRGVLASSSGRFEVSDTRKVGEGAQGHVGRVARGRLRVGEDVEACVDRPTRAAIALNHSATHLLHAALRRVLGDHVTQKGSLVAPERLRFDFSHVSPLTREEMWAVERLVNDQIRVNAEVQTEVMGYDEAKGCGAMALFGEKYGDRVRVLRIGDFSLELCGGTHVRRAGDIGYFKILSETGVASGVRRIEAVTGETAVKTAESAEDTLARLAALMHAGREDAEDKARQLLERVRKLEKDLEGLKGKLAANQGGDLASQAVEIAGIKVLAARLDGVDSKALRDTVDRLKHQLGTGAVVLAAVNDSKVNLVAGVTSDRTNRLKAGELVNMVARQVGGKGGGRADLAQAGGTDAAHLDAALRSVPEWVRQRLDEDNLSS